MPAARKTDPYTSHLAADQVMEYTALQIRLMQIFEMGVKGYTDEELIRAYSMTFGISFPASDSSIRSRRAELRDRGNVSDSGQTRLTRLGHKSVVWVEAGRLF